MLEDGVDLLAGNAVEPGGEVIRPGTDSMFSKSASTGTRVPLKTQAPPTWGCTGGAPRRNFLVKQGTRRNRLDAA